MLAKSIHRTVQRPLFLLTLLGGLTHFPPVKGIAQESSEPKNQETSQVDFAADLLPIFTKNCTACHNEKNADGGLNLESYQALMAGGDSGPSIVAENFDQSYLLHRVSGDEEPIMPPEDNQLGAARLTSAELDQLRDWILQGARPPDSLSAPAAITWQPLPESVQPINAMAYSPDGQFFVYGRGNVVRVAPQSAIAQQEISDQRVGSVLMDVSRQNLLDSGSDDSAELSTSDAPTNETHRDIVQSVAISPDCQRIATGGFRNVKIWRRRLTAEVLLPSLSPKSKLSVISPDGKRIASAITPHEIEVVEIASGQSHRYPKTHSSPIVALHWLANSDSLVSCDSGGTICKSDRMTREVVRLQDAEIVDAKTLVATHGDRLYLLAGDGRVGELVLTNSEDDIQDAQQPRSAIKWLPSLSDVVAIAVTTTQQPILLAASADGNVALVDCDTHEIRSRFGCDAGITAIDISPDGRIAATTDAQQTTQIWRTDEGGLIATLDSDAEQTRLLRVASADVDRQRQWVESLVSQAADLKAAGEKETEAANRIQMTRDQAAETLSAKESELQTAVSALAEAKQQSANEDAVIEPKKKAVDEAEAAKTQAASELAKLDQSLAAAMGNAARVAAEVSSMQENIESEKATQTTIEQHAEQIRANGGIGKTQQVAFSEDGSRVFVACDDLRVRVYATDNGVPLATLSGVNSQIQALTRSDRSTLLAVSENGGLHQWAIDLPWDLERTIGSSLQSPLSDRVTALDFSPDGQLLAIGGGPPSRFGEVLLVNLVSGELVLSLDRAHSDTVFAAKFSADGRYLATAAADKLCRVFRVPSGQLQRTFEGHTHHVLGVAWKEDGQTLATAGADASIKIWKLSSGEQLRNIAGFGKEVVSLSFLGNTEKLVACSADASVRLMNSGDGKTLRNYAGADHGLYTLSLSSDGSWLTTAGQTGVLRSWQVQP